MTRRPTRYALRRWPGAEASGSPATFSLTLHLAPRSVAGILGDRIDERREVFPVANPGGADLDKFMFASDAPYEGGGTADGGVQILAKGRSAICLLVWLEDVARR